MAGAHFPEGKLRNPRDAWEFCPVPPSCSQVPFLVCRQPWGPAVAECQLLEAI